MRYTVSMALAANITDNNEFVNDERVRRGTITLDTSYPTGGSAFTPALFGLNVIKLLKIDSLSNDGATLCAVDVANAKVKCFSALSTEVANTTNLSAKSVQFEVVGQ
jgi:hypothetical protein